MTVPSKSISSENVERHRVLVPTSVFPDSDAPKTTQLVFSTTREPEVQERSPGCSQPGNNHHTEIICLMLEERRRRESWLDVQEKILEEELMSGIPVVDADYPTTLYQNLVSDPEIDQFLADEACFDRGSNRWKTSSSTEEENESHALRSAVADICSRIILVLGQAGDRGHTRTIIDTHDMRFMYENGRHYSQPSIAIKATGLSFQAPVGAPDGVGYTNVSAIIDVRSDTSMSEILDQASELVVHAKQIFLSQPNRSYSRSISISENHVRLVHYDRSGGYCTPLINIHEDPQTFVRLVLGLASTNESILGLDTRFQWTTHVISGRKVAGTLTTRTPSGLEKAYRIKASPQFQRDIIRGRGTICWDAVDPETNRHVLLKIAWRATPRRSETVYLEMARGVSGIVQMLAFEDDTVDTKSFRPSGFSLKDFSNRVQLLLVLDLYGPSVWHFRSRIQLLSAFRAAMAGHAALFRKGVVHRDISVQNILLGGDDSPEGFEGVLIDLDMSDMVELSQKTEKHGSNLTGTRKYQSIAILVSSEPINQPAPPHDYFDDLEAFFYALSHITHAFAGPNQLKDVCPTKDPLRPWDSPEDRFASAAKIDYLARRLPFSKISPYWGRRQEPYLKFFVEFQLIVREVALLKDSIRDDFDSMEQANQEMLKLAEKWPEYHEKVMSLFDKVLGELKEEGLNEEELKAQSDALLPALSSLERPVNMPMDSKSSGQPHDPNDDPNSPRPMKKRPSEGMDTDETQPDSRYVKRIRAFDRAV